MFAKLVLKLSSTGSGDFTALDSWVLVPTQIHIIKNEINSFEMFGNSGLYKSKRLRKITLVLRTVLRPLSMLGSNSIDLHS